MLIIQNIKILDNKRLPTSLSNHISDACFSGFFTLVSQVDQRKFIFLSHLSPLGMYACVDALVW